MRAKVIAGACIRKTFESFIYLFVIKLTYISFNKKLEVVPCTKLSGLDFLKLLVKASKGQARFSTLVQLPNCKVITLPTPSIRLYLQSAN